MALEYSFKLFFLKDILDSWKIHLHKVQTVWMAEKTEYFKAIKLEILFL